MKRKPVVAGKFYSADSKELRCQIKQFISAGKMEKKPALGCICPHAGFIYSGDITGRVLSGIETKDTYIVLGANHTGLGRAFSVAPNYVWETPLGGIEIDSILAEIILKEIPLAKADFDAHLNEHSIEVQLPFIQYLNPGTKIVPIVVSDFNLKDLHCFGQGLAEIIQKYDKKVCILASSDMNHYESQEITEKKDKKAIEAVINLDEEALAAVVSENNISMCGVLPVLVLISAMKAMGVSEAQLIDYHTSGDISGDFEQVVGYAGVIFSRQ